METYLSQSRSNIEILTRICYSSLIGTAIILCNLSSLFAEGTKELNPSLNDKGFIQIWDITDQPNRKFATYLANADQRLHIKICNPGEKIYMGFRIQNAAPNNTAYFRLKDPSGNVVMGPTLISSANTTGNINTYNEAVAGPKQLVGANGYDGFEYTSTTTGDYYIEFNYHPTNNPTFPATASTYQRTFEFFDITVGNAANKAVDGRLWCKAWDLILGNFTRVFNGRMFIYANDGIVTKVEFNAIQPNGFIVSANSKGCTNTGNSFENRLSRPGNVTFPEYKIFLNDPDINCYPTGIFGKLNSAPTISGCDPNNRCINISVDKEGNVDVILDLDGNPGYNPGTRDRVFSTILKVGNNCIPWDGKDGQGKMVVPGTTFPIQIDYFNGITHLPLYDVENHTKGFIVDLVRPVGPKPMLFWDDSGIPGGTKNLTGCNDPGGCHAWPFTEYTNTSASYGDVKTINTWWYA
ncbi:MAG TPA: gliding motility-associated C-terminal domain-containing protein, partial [Cytophagaceae bacterium]